MVFLTAKMGPKGQVVVPKPFRDEYGMRPGDEVVFEDDYVQGRKKLVLESRKKAAGDFAAFLYDFRKNNAVKGFKYDSDEAYDEMMEERFSALFKKLGKGR